MRITLRSRLVAGFLTVLFVGTAAAVVVLSMVSRSASQLQQVVERDDVLALKTQEVRYAMLEMSDAMRGFLLDPTNIVELERKASADSVLSVRIAELRVLAPSRDVQGKINQAAEFDEATLNKLEDAILRSARAGKTVEAGEMFNGSYLQARGIQ
jgi:ABC-type transport system involved in cytochrome c biogenesis permease subunit